jgi:hypothetical protein
MGRDRGSYEVYEDMVDSEMLRVAAGILRRRTKKPKSLILRFVCFALESCADRIAEGTS